MVCFRSLELLTKLPPVSYDIIHKLFFLVQTGLVWTMLINYLELLVFVNPTDQETNQ